MIDDEVDSAQAATNGGIETTFSTKDVKITTTSITVSSIVNRLKHQEIDLQPDFQRKGNLWNKKR
jgi:hypothetical protein